MKDQIGFVEILEKIVQTWKEQRAKFLASAKEIMPKLKEFTDEGLKGAGEGDDENLDVDLLEEAYQQFVTRFDPVNGGFGCKYAALGVRRGTRGGVRLMDSYSATEVSGPDKVGVLAETGNVSSNCPRCCR